MPVPASIPSPRTLDVLLFAGFVRRLPWAESAWVPDIARGLVSRGHRVEVCVDGCDDIDTFRDLSLVVHRPTRKHFGAEPFAFRTFARRLRRKRPNSVALSLTPIICGDVWLPIDRRSRDIARDLFTMHHPFAALLELSHHPWLIHELLAERRALQDAPRHRVQPLSIGPHAPGSSLRSLGYAARVEPFEGAARGNVRRTTRERLGIGANDTVLLLSGTHTRRDSAAAFMQAFATLTRSATPSRAFSLADKPTPRVQMRLIVTGRSAHTIDRAARAAGVADLIVHAGSHVDMRPLLAAADAAVAAFGEPGLGTGRFVSEAIRAELPVVAHEHAPGSDLADSGLHKPGVVVRGDSPEAWLAGLGKLADVQWMLDARRAAARVKNDLTIDRVVERLESYLIGALR
ncbi:MAG: glycosyltransferase [Phycisphaerales bacterium]|nr:glycosyltransferase [Phycisphaerales bacterium]